MLKELKKLLYLVNSLIIIVSCNGNYKGDFSIIQADKDFNHSACPVKINQDVFYIKNIRKYKNGKLFEYQGCASEGLYTENFSKNNTYSKEDELLKNLSVKRRRYVILYLDKSYKIEKEIQDSIFVKLKKDEFLILVGKIPPY